MIQLNNTYSRDNFLRFLDENFLPDFQKDIRPASTQGVSSLQKAYSLGRSESLDLQVFEFSFEGSPNKRVTLTKDAFQVMKSSAIFRALAIFHSPDSDDWRLSLMTATPERTEKGKVALSYSNPKRLSFFLGPNAKVNTPTKFILKKGNIIDFDDLKSRFSIEVVNKEFYKEISELFTQLVGGSVYKGKQKEDYEALLKLPYVQVNSQTSLEFAVRLIGRVIFCWFLREKKSDQGKSLMPNDLLSLEAVKNNSDYYHKILEPIFFEVLNKPIKSRKDNYAKEPFSSIPYLNGGLFSPHDDDFFSYNEGKQAVNQNIVIIPDEWIRKFFEVLETYNFTIDENTGFDEELSIDPEMLGRIFENLLAEINPETGESARKSTGSYYTPRVIVDYMVDESLLLYLKNQTHIDEEKLRAVISYDLNDNEQNLLNEDERERIINALDKVKILDPACGSGAFPIGALQKIVFILQQTDPEGKMWFKKQIKNTSPELRRVIEREFVHRNNDYIRKLGIIRENIYGVDIQPIATEISRLRCFLTLVVDERIKEDSDNRGIEPLPNLDFKFVTANTLIGLPESQANSQGGLFEDATGIEELKELRDMFFNASGAERDQLKLQFVQAQNRMFQRLISDRRRGLAELTTKLTTWDPFSHKSASWFDPEWMFGIKEGFDIVIANPPYIKEYTDKKAFDGLRDMPYYQGKMDLWYFFACFSLDILKKSGIECFISSNNWVSNSGASILRNKIVSEAQIVQFIDFGNYKVFESTEIQTMVYLIKKCYPLATYELNYSKLLNDKITKDSLTTFLNSKENINQSYIKYKVKFTKSNFVDKYITFLEPDISEVLDKIANGKKVIKLNDKEVANGIHPHHALVTKSMLEALNQGYKVGQGIFLLTKSEIENLELSSNEFNLLKPVYTSKELHRYYSDQKNHYWIIYTDSRFKNKKEIDQYPHIKKHLDQFRKVITSDNKPYGLHRSREEKFFTGEKLLSLRKCSLPTFTYSNFDCYVLAEYYVIKTNRVSLKYLTALLNSKIVKFWLLYQGKRQGNIYQIDKEPLVNIPITIPSKEQEKEIVDLIEKILQIEKAKDNLNNQIIQSQVKDYEWQIDQMVYKLYGLTDEEIKIVEGNSSQL